MPKQKIVKKSRRPRVFEFKVSLKDVSPLPVRGKPTALRLLDLIQKYERISPTQRPGFQAVFTTDSKTGAEGWSDIQPNPAVAKFHVNLAKIPAELIDQIYVGFESGYLEFGFRSPEARLWIYGAIFE